MEYLEYKCVPTHKRTVAIQCRSLLDHDRLSEFLHSIFGSFCLGSYVYSWKGRTVLRKTIVFPELHFIRFLDDLYVFVIKDGIFYTFDRCININIGGKVCMYIGQEYSIDEIISNFFTSQWTEFPFSTRFLIPYKKVYKPRLRKMLGVECQIIYNFLADIEQRIENQIISNILSKVNR